MESVEFRILVVDDEDIVVRALAGALRGRDLRVRTCTDPNQVAALMDTERFDLIISDEHMPGLNGIRLLGRLRETHPETTRVLLTGHGTVETAAEAINDAGVFKFLTKPWRQEQLNAVVEAARQRTQSQRKPPPPVPAADRRRAMLEELEREHPGIIHTPPGVYPVHPTPVAEALLELVDHALHLDEDVAARLDAPLERGRGDRPRRLGEGRDALPGTVRSYWFAARARRLLAGPTSVQGSVESSRFCWSAPATAPRRPARAPLGLAAAASRRPSSRRPRRAGLSAARRTR